MDQQNECRFEDTRTLDDRRKEELALTAARRRLVAGGLSAAPILMAFKSQSALAQVACQTPSGAMSGNLSQGNTLSSTACLLTNPDTYAKFQAGNPSAPSWPNNTLWLQEQRSYASEG